jgi:hypothetical protein
VFAAATVLPTGPAAAAPPRPAGPRGLAGRYGAPTATAVTAVASTVSATTSRHPDGRLRDRTLTGLMIGTSHHAATSKLSAPLSTGRSAAGRVNRPADTAMYPNKHG